MVLLYSLLYVPNLLIGICQEMRSWCHQIFAWLRTVILRSHALWLLFLYIIEIVSFMIVNCIIVTGGNIMRIPSSSLHTFLPQTCPSLWIIVQAHNLNKLLDPQLVSVPDLVLTLSPMPNHLSSHGRLQPGDKILLSSFHYCVLFFCHQGLLLLVMLCCHRLRWSLSSCLAPEEAV